MITVVIATAPSIFLYFERNVSAQMSSRPGTRKETSRGRRDLLKSRATATTRLGTGNRGFYSEIVTPGAKDKILVSLL